MPTTIASKTVWPWPRWKRFGCDRHSQRVFPRFSCVWRPKSSVKKSHENRCASIAQNARSVIAKNAGISDKTLLAILSESPKFSWECRSHPFQKGPSPVSCDHAKSFNRWKLTEQIGLVHQQSRIQNDEDGKNMSHAKASVEQIPVLEDQQKWQTGRGEQVFAQEKKGSSRFSVGRVCHLTSLGPRK